MKQFRWNEKRDRGNLIAGGENELILPELMSDLKELQTCMHWSAVCRVLVELIELEEERAKTEVDYSAYKDPSGESK